MEFDEDTMRKILVAFKDILPDNFTRCPIGPLQQPGMTSPISYHVYRVDHDMVLTKSYDGRPAKNFWLKNDTIVERPVLRLDFD